MFLCIALAKLTCAIRAAVIAHKDLYRECRPLHQDAIQALCDVVHVLVRDRTILTLGRSAVDMVVA